MKITIQETDNGFILTGPSPADGNRARHVFGGADTSDDSSMKENLKLCFLEAAELLGYGYDRWGSENLNISWDKRGHKLE